MRRKTGGGVSPRSRAAVNAASAGSSAWSNLCSTALESRRSCRSAATTFVVLLLTVARPLLVAHPDSDIHAQHDDEEIDRDREPVVRADMCGETTWAQLSLFEPMAEVDGERDADGVIIRAAARRVNKPDASGLLAALDHHIVEGYVPED